MKKKRRFLELRMPAGYDKVIHACVIILMVFGSIMVVSTSVGASAKDSGIVLRTIGKQFIFICLSYFIMTKLAVNFFHWKKRKGFDAMFKFVGLAILGSLLLTQAFKGANGSKAWIYLPQNISIQPSEFAKTYLILIFGLTVNYFMNRKTDLIQYLKEPIIFLGLSAIFIYIQPDAGTLMVMALIFATCFLVPSHYAIRPAQKVVKSMFFVLFLVVLFVSTEPGIAFLENVLKISPYKLNRFTSVSNPFENIYSSGYNLVESVYAIANGGFTGLGIGASEQKYGYLPEAETDFILAVTIEELGVLGLLIILVCYGLILYRLLYYAKKTMSEGYRVILMGCFMYLSIHFILNIGGVSGIIPLTGVPLLFMSAGGSSVLSISMLMGVCQSIIAMTKNQSRQRLAQKGGVT